MTLLCIVSYDGLGAGDNEILMSYEAITCQIKDQICYITLNRPAADNAINIQMAGELEEVCRQVNQEDDIKAVIISGSGDKTFCSGEDLNQFSGTVLDESPSLAEIKDFTLRYNVAEMIAGIECPVIAAINGDAFSAGLSLALSCDLRIASDNSLFGIPDISRGYFLANGITQLLPRIVGRSKALELMLTSKNIEAQEAYRIGLIHKTVPQNDVLPEAEKLAIDIASQAPIALRYVKEVVNKGLDMTLEQGLRLECDLYMILQSTQDRIEGVNSFREKRPPHFTGE